MQKNTFKKHFFVLLVLIFSSCAVFAVAQDKDASQNIFSDSDQDGLSDTEEMTYGTDPNNPDTDGDSYSDGVEVRGGYNPLKPAPGDKLVPETPSTEILAIEDSGNEEKNLTQELAKKASLLSQNSENGEASLDSIQAMVTDLISSEVDETTLPEISADEIKIKKQNYSNLSEEKAKEKRKEDFIDYAVSTFYILSSNSPIPITSSMDVSKTTKSLFKNLSSAAVSSNFSSFEKYSESGEKMLEQLKEVEVPEEMVETHKKGLQFAKYSITLQDLIKPNPKDPISELVNLTKAQGLLESLSGFLDEVEQKVSEYDLLEDSDLINEKIKATGINLPEIDNEALLEELEKLKD